MKKQYEKGKEILKKLLDNDYQAFFVGGFVRDYLIGMKTDDIDITTDATPNQVQLLFEKTKPTGLKYGTITVFKGIYKYEVTTFRNDGDYLNYRRPENVSFSSSIESDLERRDFTINALAMNYNEDIIDLFSGRKDLELRLIRAIGDPDTRFNEDALRILRAFRFVSKLGFDIEYNTFLSIKNNMKLLKEIAIERVLVEIKKMFQGKHYQKAIRLLNEANIREAFPELAEGIKILAFNENYTINYLEFFALCFYINQSEITEKWRFSNKEKAIIEKVIELSTVTETDDYNEMIIYRLGKDIPLMANNISRIINSQNDQEKRILEIYDNLPIHKTCDLKFKGQDILQLTTIKNAEVIGDIIDDITLEIITNRLKNDYEEIKKYTMELLENKYGK